MAHLERHHCLFILEPLSPDNARGPHFFRVFNGLTDCARSSGSGIPILHFILRVGDGKTIGNPPSCMDKTLVCLGRFTQASARLFKATPRIRVSVFAAIPAWVLFIVVPSCYKNEIGVMDALSSWFLSHDQLNVA